MNKVKEYFEQLFMMLGMQNNRIGKLGDEVQKVKKLVSKKKVVSNKKSSKTK